MIILTWNMMIISIPGRLHGFKVVTSTVHFFTSLPIQSAYGSNSQDLFQKFDLTTQKVTFKKVLFVSVSVSLPFLSRSVSES